MNPEISIGKDKYAIGGLAGLTIILFGQYLLTWPTPLIYPVSSLGTDLPREIWPLAYFVKQSLLTARELPLWRPYLLSGAPIIGHPIAPIFYPPNWITLILPIALALNINIALHIFWMGLGTYLYLRWETGTRWEAALVSAIIFSQAPMWIAHISGGHVPMIAAIAWWPWIWLGWNRYITTTKTRWLVMVGVGLAAQIMNHGMFIVLSLFAIAVFTLVKSFQLRRLVYKRLIKGWIISSGVAFSLSAIHLLPFLELLRLSTRAAITRQDTGFGSLPIPLIFNALFPPDLKFPEWYLYPGVGALALVLTGLALGWSTRERYAMGAFLGALVMTFGSNTPVFDVFYAIIPGFSILRVPARWWLFSNFALALLAGWSLEKWLSRSASAILRPKLLLIGCGVFYAIMAIFSLIFGTSFPYRVIPSAVGMIVLMLILLGAPSKRKLVLIAAIVFLELWWTSEGLLRPQHASDLQIPSPIITLLKDAAQKGERSFAPYGGFEMSNLAAFNLRAADGYDPFAFDAYSRFASYAGGCDYSSYSASVPPTASNPAAVLECPDFKPNMQLLALLNVRYVLLPKPSQIPQTTLVLSHDGLWVYELPPGFGRAFGVTEGLVASPDECLAFLRQIDLGEKVVLEEELPFEPAGRPLSVISRQETSNSETFLVNVTNPGMLVRSESWAPAWKASVDGKSVEVLRVDCAIQGVWLEPGDQRVTFTYDPNGFIVGRWISLSACIVLLAGLLIPACRSLHVRWK